MPWISSKDVLDYIDRELHYRRSDRYEIVSFDDLRDVVNEAIDYADEYDPERDDP